MLTAHRPLLRPHRPPPSSFQASMPTRKLLRIMYSTHRHLAAYDGHGHPSHQTMEILPA